MDILSPRFSFEVFWSTSCYLQLVPLLHSQLVEPCTSQTEPGSLSVRYLLTFMPPLLNDDAHGEQWPIFFSFYIWRCVIHFQVFMEQMSIYGLCNIRKILRLYHVGCWIYGSCLTLRIRIWMHCSLPPLSYQACTWSMGVIYILEMCWISFSSWCWFDQAADSGFSGADLLKPGHICDRKLHVFCWEVKICSLGHVAGDTLLHIPSCSPPSR